MNLWTPDQDRALLSISEAGPNLTNQQIATLYTERTGIATTEDAVRNRLRRIRGDIASAELARVVSADEDEFDLPAVPKEKYVGPRLVFFDLEATALKANMGRILCGSFADSWGNVKTLKYTDFPGKTIIDDAELVRALAAELNRYDLWVTWNGKLYDIPLLNARLLKAGADPLRSDRMHSDVMWHARQGSHAALIGTSRLEGVSQFFRTPNSKTGLSWETWQLAAAGDDVALAEIVEHCEADVLTLRDVYEHLRPLIRGYHR